MSLVPFGWNALWLRSRDNLNLFKLFARLCQMGLVQGGWWLDEVWMRQWKGAAYRGPIFILGHQRSGTTLVHRALTNNPHAVGATLAQMAMPSLSLWQIGRSGLALDARCGGHIVHWLQKKEHAAFSPLEDFHRTRLGEVEEDEFFFWTLVASGLCANSSASSMDNRALDFLRFPETWSAHRRQLVWNWYEACLRKLAFFASKYYKLASPPWVIAKNPAFSHRIPELLSQFPDARFIILHRDPCHAIASRLCLIQRIWSAKEEGAVMAPQHIELIYQDSLKIYRGLEKDVFCIPASRRLELTSKLLKRNPVEAMTRIECAFGIKVSASPQPQAGQARVGLTEFGLTRARVKNDLVSLFKRKIWEAT